MTFNPDQSHLWNKDFPMFCLWAFSREVLFLPTGLAEDEEEKRFNLEAKVYILMKRLGQSYSEIMRMDADERDKYFEVEFKLMQEEKKNAEKQQ